MDDAMSDGDPAIGAIGQDQIHDLRNRLTVVKGIAQLLDRQVRRDDWQREKIVSRIDRLQDEIRLLEQLVEGYGVDDSATPRTRPDLLH